MGLMYLYLYHYRISQLAQVHRIYILRSFIRMIKEIRRKLVGNVAGIGDIGNTCTVLVENSERKRPL
jgi:hypothetical protein